MKWQVLIWNAHYDTCPLIQPLPWLPVCQTRHSYDPPAWFLKQASIPIQISPGSILPNIQVSKKVLHIYFVDPNSHDNVDYYQSIHDFGLEYCPKHCLTTAMARLIANSHSYRCFLARAAEWKTARNGPAVSHWTFWPEHTNSFSTFLEQQFVWQHKKSKLHE